ncbi:MAG: hypothetical protein IKV83_08620 [Muribaculaceae bacterium]|nr:hypothetical protein [Muribaculaceae bacterium]
MNEILTPCILQSIIICCTIIILCIIGLVAYGIKKRGPRDWASYIFAASVFLTIGIAIFSLCYCGDRNVLDFISLASAIISIILAVVTIVYSYFINSRSSGQIDQLNKAARDVSEATSSYTKSAESLQENIRKIIETVNNVEIKTDNIIGHLAKQQGNPNDNKFPNKEQKRKDNFDINTYVDNYVKISSPLGIMAMYACIKAYDSDNKEFSLNLFFDDSNLAAYCGGFLIATTSTGLIHVLVDFNKSSIQVMGCTDIIKHYVGKWISESDINRIKGLCELKEKIDAYFSKPNQSEEKTE